MAKRAYTKKQKRTLRFGLSVIGLLLGIGLWRWSLDINPTVDIPTPTMPSPNAYDFYTQAMKAYDKVQASSPNAPPVDPIIDTRDVSKLTRQQLSRLYPTSGREAYLARHAEVLKLLRQGFAYPYRQPPAKAVKMPFSTHAQHRDLARLLCIESHARAEHGNRAAAGQSALDILHLGHDIPRGGGIIATLVGIAINQIGRRELHNLLSDLDADTCHAAALRIEEMETDRFSLAKLYQEEKWLGQSIILEALRQPNWRADLLTPVFTTDKPPTLKERIEVLMLSKRRVMNNYRGFMDALIHRAQLPYKTDQAPQPRHYLDPLSKLVVPGAAGLPWIVASDKTGNSLLATMLALRACRLERGDYPATLQKLTPYYLKKVPVDPFGDGGALRYRKAGDEYLLYSIGPDAVDDGGRAIADLSEQNPYSRHLVQRESKGDIVAGINR